MLSDIHSGLTTSVYLKGNIHKTFYTKLKIYLLVAIIGRA